MAAIVYIQEADGTVRQKTELPKGASLLEAFRSDLSGMLEAPCGGNGLCGKCRIKVLSGNVSPPSNEELKLLDNAEREEGIRLACQCYPLKESDVWIQAETTGGAATKESFSHTAEGELRFTSGSVSLDAGNLTNQLPLTDQISRVYSLDRKFLQPVSLQRLGSLAQQGRPVRVLLDREKAVRPLFDGEVPYGCAVDIGTTTLAVYLVDLLEGTVTAHAAQLNSQRSWGADVISRAQHASNHPKGLDELRNAITSQVDRMITEVLDAGRISPDSLAEITIAGNTIMLHLLLGIQPEGITVSPFLPVITQQISLPSSSLGFIRCTSASVTLLGSISGYVGADITAGLQAVSLMDHHEPALFIDIGTNGEIVLWDGRNLLCCSSAAGPAFEGATVLHGTGGIPGAICSVTPSVEQGKLLCRTIDDLPPIGICASGILDALAAALDFKAMDATGALTEEGENSVCSVATTADGPALIISTAGKQPLYLTQRDIREIQLAKSAIAAGVRTLLDASSLKPRDIKRTVLAGGFGARIHVPSALRLGLLPLGIGGEVISGGNTAGKGAVQSLADRNAEEGIEKIRKRAQYIELSASKVFQQLFLEEMTFPGDEL